MRLLAVTPVLTLLLLAASAPAQPQPDLPGQQQREEAEHLPERHGRHRRAEQDPGHQEQDRRKRGELRHAGAQRDRDRDHDRQQHQDVRRHQQRLVAADGHGDRDELLPAQPGRLHQLDEAGAGRQHPARRRLARHGELHASGEVDEGDQPGDDDARPAEQRGDDRDGGAEQERHDEHRDELPRLVHGPERPRRQGGRRDRERHVDRGAAPAKPPDHVASRFARLRWRSSR